MSGSPKQRLEETEATESETQELRLRDGKTLVVSDAGADQLVEIRGEGGLLELRIRLTDQGPVLQMEAVKMQIKATESVEIHSERVTIAGTKSVAVEGGQVDVDGKEQQGSSGEVHVRGKTIHLN